MRAKRNPQGIRARHSRSCHSLAGERCNCNPSYEAWAYSPGDRRKIRRTFTGAGALTEAKRWRRDAVAQLDKGTMRAPSSVTVRQAAEHWLERARRECDNE